MQPANLVLLVTQVWRAEDLQRQSEAEMADVLSQTVETELSKQHAEQSRKINALQVLDCLSYTTNSPMNQASRNHPISNLRASMHECNCPGSAPAKLPY